MYKHSKFLALLLALVMVVSFAACSRDPEPAEDESSEPESSEGSKVFINALEEDNSTRFPQFTDLIADYHELNDDTVGWLRVPNTGLDDVVVQNNDPSDNNEFYYRRDFEKNYSFNGIFYADFRNTFGSGKVEELSQNTVIYGHTMNEDRDGVMFGPLLYFLDEDYARETPYIYFSTMGEDLVWEVFSVHYTNIHEPYNRPDLELEEWEGILERAVARSIYNYEDVEVSAADDKILTLSTCCYSVPGIGSGLPYPNIYRYVIMAKQVDRRTADKRFAEFTVNESPLAPE